MHAVEASDLLGDVREGAEELDRRITFYRGHCACGVAMVTGLVAVVGLIVAWMLKLVDVPSNSWWTAAWLMAAIAAGNIAGKLFGSLYFQVMANRLARRLESAADRRE